MKLGRYNYGSSDNGETSNEDEQKPERKRPTQETDDQESTQPEKPVTALSTEQPEKPTPPATPVIPPSPKSAFKGTFKHVGFRADEPLYKQMFEKAERVAGGNMSEYVRHAVVNDLAK